MSDDLKRSLSQSEQDKGHIMSHLKCLICHKVYDSVHEYKDCIVYRHKDKQCSSVLTIPKHINSQ